MLLHNNDLISFIPGREFYWLLYSASPARRSTNSLSTHTSTSGRLPHETITGQIVVHDRNRVQQELLPVYFNHASFASLRRQLSYFSFQRVGKSRSKGVTYTNENVVEMSDILKLKRRVSTSTKSSSAVSNKQKKVNDDSVTANLPRMTTQHLEHLGVAPDVASAVLSGALHAAKTNGILEIDGANLNRFAAIGTSAGSGSSISNSFGSNSLDGKSREVLVIKKQKKKKRKSSSYMRILKGSEPRSRKDQKRLDRLLSANNVVPFIHLPDRPTENKKKDAELPQCQIAQEKGSGKDAAITALLALGVS